MSLVARLRKLINHPIKLWHGAFAVIATLLAANFLQGLAEAPHVEVKELIRRVKEELVAADREGIQRGEAPLFQLKGFEMEIQYVIRRSGDVRAEVVGVGGTAGVSSESVQKLNLHWDVTPAKTESTAPSDPTNRKADVTIGPDGDVVPGRSQ